MRNKLKKTAAVFMSVLLLLPTYALAENEDSVLVQMYKSEVEAYAQTEFPKAIDIEAGLLNAMDMLPEGVAFDSHITREEAAVLVCKMLAKDSFAESISNVSYYNDVSVYSENVGYINAVTLEGIFSGKGDGIFAPKDNLSYAEFCKLMVTATGYGVAAENSGGYPDGYIKQALKLKIATAVPMDSYVTWGDAVKMVYEAMQVDVLTVEGLSSNGDYHIEKQENGTLLGLNHDIHIDKGQITGTSLCRLFGAGQADDLKAGEIEIEGILYKYNVEKLPHIHRLTGYNTEYYYRKISSDEYELVYAYIKNAKVMELMSYEIRETYGFDAGDNGSPFIKYFVEDKNRKDYGNNKASLDKGLSLIFNTETVPRVTNAALFPSCGKVVLIDSDNNNSYDVALVTSYDMQIVDVVSIYDKHIFFKYNPTTTPLVLNPNYNDVTYDIVKDGEYISLNMLREDDVIGIIESEVDDKPYYMIELLSSCIEGTIDSISDDKVEIDGVTYGVADNFDPALCDVRLGERYKLYFDFAKELFRAEKIEENYNFQYTLINAEMTQTLGGYVRMKVCYAAGTYGKRIEVLDCADRVKVNGKMCEGSKILDELRLSPADRTEVYDHEYLRPLKYVEFNSEGKVKMIETVPINRDKGGREERTYNGDGPYNESFGEYDISYKTQMCYVPLTMNDDDWLYSELNKMKFGNAFQTLMWGSDAEGLPEAVFVWHDRTSSDPSFMIDYTRPMLIKKVRNVYSESDNAWIYKIDTMNIGANYTYLSDDRNTSAPCFADLKTGDVVFAALTSQSGNTTQTIPKISEILGGDMWSCERRIRLSDRGLSFYKSPDNLYGRIKTIRTDARANKCVINVHLGYDNFGEEILHSFDATGTPIYFYDRRENEVYLATYAAVRSEEVYGIEGASNVFVNFDEELDPNMIVIVGEK